MLRTAVWVALLGAAGSLARFGLASVVQRATPGRFPIGTLTVNVVGSFVIGVVMAFFITRDAENATVRVAMTAGFLGGFTTASAFAWETFAMLESRHIGRALGYVGGTVVACILACALGAALGRILAGR